MRILAPPQPVWVPAAILAAASLSFLELPLYRSEGGPRSSLMDVSSARARAAGLTDPAASAADTRAWLQGQALPLGLPPAREAELIRLARRG